MPHAFGGRQRIEEIAEADEIGDPSLLRVVTQFTVYRRRRFLLGCHPRSALATPAGAVLRTAHIPSGLLSRPGKRPRGSARGKDMIDGCCRNEPPAAMAAGQQLP